MPATPPDWSSLLPALLDFERSPGRYRVVLREPRPLFEHIRTVLLLAVGRPVEGLLSEPANELALRRAARFFVRTVMLRPGSDHFTLLGLTPGFEHAQLREHYRQMIRLTHPDFAASGAEAWPADAATRINLANDVLSSPEKRADYADALLTPAVATLGAKAGAPMRQRLVRPRPAVARGQERAAGLSTRAKLALGSAGAVLTAGTFLFMGQTGNEGSLAVRRVSPVQDPVLMPSTELGRPSPEPVAPPLLDAGSSETAPQETPARAVEGLRAPALAAPAEAPARPPLPASAKRTTPVSGALAAAPNASDGAGGGLSLTMETHISEAPARPAPAVRLTLAQVQPTLTNLMGSLQGGRGENVMQWIGGDWRSHPANGAFVRQFNQQLAGRRVLQVGKVQLRASQLAEQLVVDGVVQLHLEDANNTRQVKDLQLRAFFQPQDGQPVLTQLVAGDLQ